MNVTVCVQDKTLVQQKVAKLKAITAAKDEIPIAATTTEVLPA